LQPAIVTLRDMRSFDTAVDIAAAPDRFERLE
jgi:hypothetical protein